MSPLSSPLISPLRVPIIQSRLFRLNLLNSSSSLISLFDTSKNLYPHFLLILFSNLLIPSILLPLNLHFFKTSSITRNSFTLISHAFLNLLILTLPLVSFIMLSLSTLMTYLSLLTLSPLTISISSLTILITFITSIFTLISANGTLTINPSPYSNLPFLSFLHKCK